MGAVKISVDRLIPETLQGVVEEFITREGSNYGKSEVPLDTKLGIFAQRPEKSNRIFISNIAHFQPVDAI